MLTLYMQSSIINPYQQEENFMWLEMDFDDLEVKDLPEATSFKQFCEKVDCEYLTMFNDTEELYKASIQLLPEGEVL